MPTLIEIHLPPLERAQELNSIYFSQASWIFQGVTRTQLMEDMLSVIYRLQIPLHEHHSDPNSNTGSDYTGITLFWCSLYLRWRPWCRSHLTNSGSMFIRWRKRR
ncbi:hypothetical protein L208DRAFT_1404473 [Tricholoma matsutake]|nr:hypothetical protein L208DRAFT_1404473 [Tricholoma matsutake 945]